MTVSTHAIGLVQGGLLNQLHPDDHKSPIKSLLLQYNDLMSSVYFTIIIIIVSTAIDLNCDMNRYQILYLHLFEI